MKRSLRNQTSACTFLISYLRFSVHVLGPSLNTVRCFSFYHALPKYLHEDIESVQKRALLIISPECSYEDNLSRFNLFSLGSRREAACSKLFQLMNDMRIQSHQLHHLVHQRHQPTHLRRPFHFIYQSFQAILFTFYDKFSVN